jgi:hypothetical protein
VLLGELETVARIHGITRLELDTATSDDDT